MLIHINLIFAAPSLSLPSFLPPSIFFGHGRGSEKNPLTPKKFLRLRTRILSRAAGSTYAGAARFDSRMGAFIAIFKIVDSKPVGADVPIGPL